MTEKFLPIPNFPNYEINSAFVVRNRETKRICKPYVRSNGSTTVVVRRSDGKWSYRSVRSLYSQALAAQNSAKFVQLSEFPSYEISAGGVVRNRHTKRPLKKRKGNNTVQLFLPGKKKVTYRSINSLLWEAFGIIKGNPSRSLPVALQYSGRRLTFDTQKQAAKFLAEKYFFTIRTMQTRLSRRMPEICGWQVTYLASNDNVQLSVLKKLNSLAKQQKKVYGADIQPAAERRADHVRNSTSTVST